MNFQYGKDSVKTAFLYSSRHQQLRLELSECLRIIGYTSFMYPEVNAGHQLGPQLWLWLDHSYVASPYVVIVTLFQWWQLQERKSDRTRVAFKAAHYLSLFLKSLKPAHFQGKAKSIHLSERMSFKIGRHALKHQNDILQMLNKYSWLLSFPSNFSHICSSLGCHSIYFVPWTIRYW